VLLLTAAFWALGHKYVSPYVKNMPTKKKNRNNNYYLLRKELYAMFREENIEESDFV